MYSIDTGLLAEDNIQDYRNVDDDGFLIHPKNWSHETAQHIAAMNDVAELQAIHLRIVQYIRDYYFELGSFATPRRICAELEVDKALMKKFFGSCINAWRIAGLPNPGDEAMTYMN